MTRIRSARLDYVSVPIKAPRRHSDGVTRSARRGIIQLASEDGLVGLGEISARVSPDLARAVLDALPGMSVFDTTRLRLHVGQGKFPAQASAILLAGLEMAFLDMQGQHLGLPVHQLLGGQMRSEVPLVAYIFRLETPDDEPETPWHELAEEAIEKFGFETVKLKAGAVPPVDDLAAAEAVKERFPDMPLRLDPNGIWSLNKTLELLPRLSALGLEWLEDPVLTAHGMAEVRKRTAVPLATNMCVTTPSQLPEAVLLGPVDIVLLDLWYIGGLRRALDFHTALDAFKFGIGIHSGGGSPELGIGQAATLHLAAALPYLNVAADSLYHHLEDDVIAGDMFRIVDGRMPVPTAPGLGVSLDKEKVKRYLDHDAPQARTPLAESDPHVYPAY